MRHTAHQRIIGAILCGVVLIVSGSEGLCQEQVCGPDGEGCTPQLLYPIDQLRVDFNNIAPAAKPAAPQPRIPRTSFEGGELSNIADQIQMMDSVPGGLASAGYNGKELGNYLNGVADQVNYYGNPETMFAGRADLPKDDIVNFVNQMNGTNKALNELTEQDFRDAAKKAEDAQEKEEDKEKEEADKGHNSAQEEKDKKPTPKPGNCGPGGCNPGGGGCPGGGCNPGGGAGAAGFAGRGGAGILGGIAQMAQQMLPQLLQGVLQGLLQGGGQQGGGQQNGYGIQQLPPELYPDDADIMRQVEATQTAVYAEATAIAEQALQATATAEAIPPEEEEEEQDEETSESQPEAQPTATPITSPTRDSMIGGLE